MSQCYVSTKKGAAGAHAACSAEPDYASHAARFVSKERKKGHIVTLVPTEKARELLLEYINSQPKQYSLEPQ